MSHHKIGLAREMDFTEQQEKNRNTYGVHNSIPANQVTTVRGSCFRESSVQLASWNIFIGQIDRAMGETQEEGNESREE